MDGISNFNPAIMRPYCAKIARRASIDGKCKMTSLDERPAFRGRWVDRNVLKSGNLQLWFLVGDVDGATIAPLDLVEKPRK